MRVDEHNACPACPAPVRKLYFTAQHLVDLIDGDVDIVKLFPSYLDELRGAVRGMAPWIDAHHANQNHVLSAELASAREPVCPS